MSENYFENLRKVSATLDQGISKLQETWKMPHLLLCKNSDSEKRSTKIIEDLKKELKILKESLEENTESVSYFRDTQTEFLKESINAIKTLKEEVDETKVLFVENGYVEEPLDDNISILNNRLESLYVDANVNASDSFIENLDNTNETDVHYKCSKRKDNVKSQTNDSNINLQKNVLKEQLIKPVYSPYYYKINKK